MNFQYSLMFLFFIFSATSFAQKVEPKKYLNELPIDLLNESLIQAKSAVRSYRADSHSSCSLVVTSSSCYAVTSAHCFRDFLDKKKLIQWVEHNGFSKRKVGRISDMKVVGLELPTLNDIRLGWEKLSSGENEVLFNGKRILDPEQKKWALSMIRQMARNPFNPKDDDVVKHIDTGQAVKVTIINGAAHLVSIGDGIASWDNWLPPFQSHHSGGEYPDSLEDLGEVFKTLRQNHFGDLADYALLKLPGDKCTCAKTGQLKNDRDTVVMIGYPGDAEKQDKTLGFILGANQFAPSISTGNSCEIRFENLRRQIENLSTFKKFLVAMLYSRSHAELENQTKIYHEIYKNEVIIHNARSGPGASGGGLFNSDGDLIGINMRGSNFEKDPDPVSAALSIKYIKDELKKKLPADVFAEAFQCNSPAPLQGDPK